MNATTSALQSLDWQKSGGLIPAIVQDAQNGRVLMLGYMNQESLQRTLQTGRVVFFSRSRNALWTKGETSGNYLDVVQVTADCDDDTILVLANPVGPACHKGTLSCFADAQDTAAGKLAFLVSLEQTIARRIAETPEGSYTARLYAAGVGRIAQKVGEEGVETALAAVTREDPALIGEMCRPALSPAGVATRHAICRSIASSQNSVHGTASGASGRSRATATASQPPRFR
jgi:phosphoribosyl-ATP pyrophosphohydrolase/phosphoribosyl-AMP cyclohydrolase